MPRLADLTGRKFGRLTVISRAEDHVQKNGRRRTMWLCRCDCGSDARQVFGEALVGGRAGSCGCYCREMLSRRRRTHGKSGTQLHWIWTSIKQRCFNPKCKSYKRYGARGITMHGDWASSFEKFAIDVGDRPGSGYSLDRIDNDGDYEPGNVRWATPLEQYHNSRCWKDGSRLRLLRKLAVLQLTY